MDIRPVNSVGAGAPVVSAPTSAQNNATARQIVSAVREINKSELMGEGRQLTFTRDPETRQPVIQIVDQNTGDVIDQLPSETVLRLAADLK
jgi:flagellar protein FlaG